jgi:PAS domain S-box-containing protein
MTTWKRSYIFFLLVIVLMVLGFVCGGWLFYHQVSRHSTCEISREEHLVAGRISDNLQLYLKRVRRTIDGVLDFDAFAGPQNLKSLVAARFRLLWGICPEIKHLVFLSSDGKIYYTGREGDFLPLGLSFEEIYEWQHFSNRFWEELHDDRLHQRLASLACRLPGHKNDSLVPVILFAKKVRIKGNDAGTILIPYRFDFMFKAYCQSLVENRRGVIVVDNRGEVVFSSYPGLLGQKFFPAFASSIDRALESDNLSLLVPEERSRVVAALGQGKYFTAKIQVFPASQASPLLATFQRMDLVAPNWTIVVTAPDSRVQALAWRLLPPMAAGCLLAVVMTIVVSLLFFRRLNRFARENAIFRAGLESSPDGVMVLDVQGRYLLVNPVYCKLLNSSPQELTGTFFHPDADPVRGLPENILARVVEQGNWRGLVTYYRDGEQPEIEVNQIFSAILWQGNLVGYFSSLGDVTEERRLKREVEVYTDYLQKEVQRQTELVLQSQKMESIGLLAAGFAHDFNNLLASMQGNLELLEMMLSSSPDKAGRYLDKIRKASIQASDLVRQILTFSRRDLGTLEVVTVVDLIEAVMVLVPPSLPAQISYDCLDDSLDLKVEIDRPSILQAILNLILNAGESFAEERPAEPWIRITSKARYIDDYLSRRFNLTPGQWFCEISVVDNGVGIPPAMLGRIFDPFFSTKEWSNRKGTGLGLAVVYRTVANHGGTVTVSSEVGSGTVFKLFLPVSGPAGKALPAGEGGEEVPIGRFETYQTLVVDDEQMLRESVKVFLELQGMRVATAADGLEALDFLEREKVDLVVLDLVMPGMGGEDLLEEMGRLGIKIPVLIMTGTVNEGFRLSRRFPVVLEVLEKPFSRNDLIRTCSRLLL